MLWGGFCLTVMEAVIPRLVPLQLKSLGTRLDDVDLASAACSNDACVAGGAAAINQDSARQIRCFASTRVPAQREVTRPPLHPNCIERREQCIDINAFELRCLLDRDCARQRASQE
jgi:hypothetical protein